MSVPSKKLSKAKKWALFFGLAFFAFQIVLPAALVPRQAKALFGVGDVSVTIGDIPRTIFQIISKAYKTAGDVGFKNVITQFLNNLAYNTAVKIATGDKGQKPLFPTKPGELLEQAADVAAGDFLDSLINKWGQGGHCLGYSKEKCGRDSDCESMEPFLVCPGQAVTELGVAWNIEVSEFAQAGEQFQIYCSLNKKNYEACIAAGCSVVQNTNYQVTGGAPNVPEGAYWALGYPQCVPDFSLCEQDDLVKLQINLLARNIVMDEQALEVTGKCPLTSIIDNFENATTDWAPNLSSRKKSQFYLVEVSKKFNPEATDVGALMKVISKAEEEGTAAAEKKEFSQSLSGAFSGVTTKISGAVKTPGPVIEKTLNEILGQSIGSKFVYTGSPIADAIGVFTNTLANKLLTKYLDGLVSDEVANRGGGSSGAFGGLLGGSSSGITAARLSFADLQRADYSVGGELDVLSKLASCPDSTDPTPDSCVIDGRFATAIQQKLTVQEAVEQGLLDGSKIFGFNTNGSEPSYVNGYPYRSLVILRSYRIIPVGWELAAKYIKEYARGNYSLNTLLQEFYNPDSPFYKLVDPNWVLKMPQVYCAREGAGSKIIYEQPIRSEDTNEDGTIDLNDAAVVAVQRQGDYCADKEQCLLENADGSCRKFGYCIEEEPIWKFDGEACPAEYNTCQSMTQRTGEQVFYLKNTLNYDGCNAKNSGCQWYCSEWDEAAGQWTCDNLPPPQDDNKMSFNKEVESCNEEFEGCTELKILRKGMGTNTVRNSSFEYFDRTTITDDRIDDGVLDYDPDVYNTLGDRIGFFGIAGGNSAEPLDITRDAYDGEFALKIINDDPAAGSHWYSPDGYTSYPIAGRTFTFSYFGKLDSCADGSTDAVGIYIISGYDPYYEQPGHGLDLGGLPDFPSSYWIAKAVAEYKKDVWQRYSLTATVDSRTHEIYTGAQGVLYSVSSSGQTCTIIVDGFQFEEGQLSNYKRYEDSPSSYLTLAPDYLNCTGDLINDDPRCNDYALVCEARDVSCEAYTSKTTGNIINGTITSPQACDPNDPASCDQCPADFVGCQAFRELPIEHVPRRPARDPVSFVPTTGQECPATAVGCEEYTNLEAVGLGGEGKEYYSWIKQCVNTDDAATEPYYTWEGSDEFGYQLKKYTLKRSNINDGPCTNMAPEHAGLAANSWPACVDNQTFDENLDGVDEPHPMATCLASEVGINPDCAEFYDSDGNTWYLLRSRVIYEDENCQSYRNSIDGPDWTHHLIPGQGNECTAVYAGCRAYKGNAGDNTRVLGNFDFENGTIDPWFGAASYSNEATYVGGHSMLTSNSAAINNINDPDVLGVQPDHSYKVSFWGKTEVTGISPGGNPVLTNFPVTFDLFDTVLNARIAVFPGQASVRTGEWRNFEVGPLYIPAATDLTNVQLRVTAPNAFFIDNIVIEEITENIYRVQNSYTECAGYENCDQYADRSNKIHYLKSFSSLCPAEKVGCEAFYDTKNSDNPFKTPYDIALKGDVNRDGVVDWDDYAYLNNYVNAVGPGFTPLDIGDLNNDGAINPVDVVFLSNNLNGITNIPLEMDNMGICRGIGAGIRDGEPCTHNSHCPLSSGDGTTTQNCVKPFYPFEPIESDNVIFLVNNSKNTCSASNKGCQRMGEPTLDADGQAAEFNDVYIKNNPDKYNETLCLWEDNACEEYTADTGSKLYFKDPGQRVCEYRKVSGQAVSSWYQAATVSGETDCPAVRGICDDSSIFAGKVCNDNADCESGGMGFCATGICAGGAKEGRQCNGDAFCPGSTCDQDTYTLVERPVDGWAGVCPDDESGCSEFRDPETPNECNVHLEDGAGDGVNTYDCDSYYQKSEQVDRSSCFGVVNRDEGCRLFYDVQGRAKLPFNLDYNLLYDSKNSTDGNPPVLCENVCDGGVNNGKACQDDLGCPGGVCDIACDSDSIIKVRKDRQCRQWLECGTTLTQEDTEGQRSNLCLSRYVCDELDDQTGYCTHAADIENANLTYTVPAFADKVSNFTGMSYFGLDWGKRCDASPDVICTGDAECDAIIPGDKCSAQIIHGYRSYPAMTEEGAITISGELVKDGDFGDSDYRLNQTLSKYLSSATEARSSLTLSNKDFITGWTLRVNSAGEAKGGIAWTEEDKNDSIVPSENANLDENNVLWVQADGQYTGASYALKNIITDQNYSASMKLRLGTVPSGNDYILVMLSYFDSGGNLITEQWFDKPLRVTDKWQSFALGPLTAGYQSNETETGTVGDDADRINYDSVRLDIVHYFDGLPANASPLDFYIDDVSMKPVLGVQYGICDENSALPGKSCMTRQDCADDANLLGQCVGSTNLARDCRLYPREDSPYCNYTDESNVTYLGWSGYCIERDPGNKKYCLNWWPVDLLMGESNIFGKLREARYSGPTPLYMCVAASGRPDIYIHIPNGEFLDVAQDDTAGKKTWSVSTWLNNHGNCTYSRFTTQAACVAAGHTWVPYGDVYKGDIARIIFEVTAAASNDWPESSTWEGPMMDVPKSEMPFFWMNNLTGRHGYNTNNDGPGEDMGNTPWQTFWCGGWNTHDRRYKQVCDHIPYSWDSYHHYTSNDGRCGRVDDLDGDGHEDGTNLFNIAAEFDDDPASATYGKLENFIGGFCDNSEGKGWLKIDAYIQFKTYCSMVAEVVDEEGTNRAWASRLASGSPYTVDGLKYGYDQDLEPYGKIAEPRDMLNCEGQSVKRFDPETWDSDCRGSDSVNIPGKTPLYAQSPAIYSPDIITYPPGQIRASSPYSCDGSKISTKICSGGPRDGYNCTYHGCDTGVCEDVDLLPCSSSRCVGGLKDGDSCVNDFDCCSNPEVDATGLPIVCKDSISQKSYCERVELPDDGVMNWQAPPGDNARGRAVRKLMSLFADVYGTWLYWVRYCDATPTVKCHDDTICNAIVPGDTCNNAGMRTRQYEKNPFPAGDYGWHNSYETMGLCDNGGKNSRPAFDPLIPQEEYCGVMPKISVRAVSGEQIANSGNAANPERIDLKGKGGSVIFYITIEADKDQVPIRLIEAEWGDGSTVFASAGNYASGTFVITHNYYDFGEFNPTIRVVDNWDWCGVMKGQNTCAGDCRYTDNMCDSVHAQIKIVNFP